MTRACFSVCIEWGAIKRINQKEAIPVARFCFTPIEGIGFGMVSIRNADAPLVFVLARRRCRSGERSATGPLDSARVSGRDRLHEVHSVG
jgi:hypothetical protein